MFRALAASLFLALAGAAPTAARLPAPMQGWEVNCRAVRNAPERLICADEELQAWDRALARSASNRLRSDPPENVQRQVWTRRRDACVDRACMIAAYKAWFEEFTGWRRLRPVYVRTHWLAADGSNRLSRPVTRGARRGTRDSADLILVDLGYKGWHLMNASGLHFFRDRLGQNAADAGAQGLVRIVDGKGVFREDPADEGACVVELTRLPRGPTGWKLVEKSGRCGGLNATLNGIYTR